MARMLIEIRAEMEDGTTHDVVADQRDIARWEIQDFGCSFNDIDSRVMLATRWLAWSALKRRGQVDMTWEDFDAQCVEAGDMPDEESAQPADANNPGQTVPSA